MTTPQQIAEAFSGHQFSDAYDHLAADIQWVLIGGATIQGRDQVIQTCEQTAAELTDTTTEFLRFLTIAGTGAVAVDTVARYEEADGTTSVVFLLRHLRVRQGCCGCNHLLLGRARPHRTPDAHASGPSLAPLTVPLARRVHSPSLQLVGTH
jgi:hypothetical protein